MAHRLLLLTIAVATSGLLACSGGSSGSDTVPNGGDGGDPGLGWEGETNVEAIFEASCSGCHATQWASCWDVQANASEVGSAVSSGAMPRNGPLSASDKSTLLGWINAGAHCSGTQPPVPEGGPAPGPILAGARPH